MSLSFLVPLAIALIAAIIGIQSQEEIVAVFSTIVAALSLLLSFILAPWMVQIFILISGLAGLRYICHRNSCQDSFLK
jgi:uncharacterized membrane protein YciS (DUF1049 family)